MRAELVLTMVLGAPDVRRAAALVEEVERRAGAELAEELKVFQDRYAYAVRTGDVGLLTGTCGGSTGDGGGPVCWAPVMRPECGSGAPRRKGWLPGSAVHRTMAEALLRGRP